MKRESDGTSSSSHALPAGGLVSSACLGLPIDVLFHRDVQRKARECVPLAGS